LTHNVGLSTEKSIVDHYVTHANTINACFHQRFCCTSGYKAWL